jgi:hypothetical protein|tara:strand:- start:194 stop:394 length:201 start_codon:yes stop_codon:yes gene_type:complete
MASIFGIAKKGLGLLGKRGRNTSPARQEKINKTRAKAIGVGVAGAGIVGAGVKKVKNIIEKDYGKK